MTWDTGISYKWVVRRHNAQVAYLTVTTYVQKVARLNFLFHPNKELCHMQSLRPQLLKSSRSHSFSEHSGQLARADVK